jgi:hypothetical protein
MREERVGLRHIAERRRRRVRERGAFVVPFHDEYIGMMAPSALLSWAVGSSAAPSRSALEQPAPLSVRTTPRATTFSHDVACIVRSPIWRQPNRPSPRPVRSRRAGGRSVGS